MKKAWYLLNYWLYIVDIIFYIIGLCVFVGLEYLFISGMRRCRAIAKLASGCAHVSSKILRRGRDAAYSLMYYGERLNYTDEDLNSIKEAAQELEYQYERCIAENKRFYGWK